MFEFLEKNAYLLSLWVPFILFFTLGLLIAWWVWYRGVSELKTALAEQAELYRDQEKHQRREHQLSLEILNLVETREKQWASKVRSKDKDISGLNTRLAGLEEKASGYKLRFNEKDAEVSKLSGQVSAFKNDLSGRDGLADDLDKKLKDRNAEIERLKVALADCDGKLKTASSQGDDSSKLQARLSECESELASMKSKLAAAPVVASVPMSTPSLGLFDGESVRRDDELGFVYTERPSRVDDLKKIKGVANVLEGKLHEFGVYRFKQIALWEPGVIAEFNERLDFSDRVQRDEWQRQAREFHKEEYDEDLG